MRGGKRPKKVPVSFKPPSRATKRARPRGRGKIGVRFRKKGMMPSRKEQKALLLTNKVNPFRWRNDLQGREK